MGGRRARPRCGLSTGQARAVDKTLDILQGIVYHIGKGWGIGSGLLTPRHTLTLSPIL
jgi:hypothetical protein